MKKRELKITEEKLPLFEIVSNPGVSLKDIKIRRFSMIDRDMDWKEGLKDMISTYWLYDEYMQNGGWDDPGRIKEEA